MNLHNPTKAAVIYSRVSTLTQARDGTSLQSQVEACRQYAAQNNYQVLEDISDDVTGASLDRTGLDRVRDLAARGLIQGVIVYSIDRMNRELGDLLYLDKELSRNGVALHFVLDEKQNTPQGMLFFQMKGAFVQYERSVILERTSRGKNQRLKEGKMVGTWMEAYGYRYITGEGRYEIIEEEAEVVRRMFDWLISERGTASNIANRLNQAGVPTKRRGSWSPSTVYRVLTNELYAGTAHWNKHRMVYTDRHRDPAKNGIMQKTARRLRDRAEPDAWVPIPVPPIISRETYEAALRRIEENARLSPRNTRHDFLLSGLLFCARCGRRYYAQWGDPVRQASPWRVYRCPNARRNPRSPSRALLGPCDNHVYWVSKIEERVWQAIADYLAAPDHTYTPHEQAADPTDANARDRRELERIVRGHKKLEVERSRMLDAYRASVIDLSLLQKEIAAIDKRRDILDADHANILARLESHHKSASRLVSLEELRREARDSKDANDFASKRQTLMDLEITGHVDGNTVTLRGLLTHDIVLKFDP